MLLSDHFITFFEALLWYTILMKTVKYPNLKHPYEAAKVSVKNRGISSEKLVNEANDYYLLSNQAIIHKKPTPIQIVNVFYPKRSAAKITEAYFKTPSTTDYNGIYQGVYIDFDVKETKNKTSFPLANIHTHQITHLKNIDDHGGFAFLIVAFTVYDQFFIVPFSLLNDYLKRSEKGRKSVTYEELKNDAFEIPLSYQPTLDYLKTLNQIQAFKTLKRRP